VLPVAAIIIVLRDERSEALSRSEIRNINGGDVGRPAMNRPSSRYVALSIIVVETDGILAKVASAPICMLTGDAHDDVEIVVSVKAHRVQLLWAHVRPNGHVLA
jgi:hypothetical protein